MDSPRDILEDEKRRMLENFWKNGKESITVNGFIIFSLIEILEELRKIREKL